MVGFTLGLASSLFWLRRLPWSRVASLACLLAAAILLLVPDTAGIWILGIAVLCIGLCSSVPESVTYAWIDSAPESGRLIGLKGVVAMVLVCLVAALGALGAWLGD